MAAYTGPFPFTNSGTQTSVVASGTSFTGNIVNNGKIQGASTGILVENASSISGAISNAGTISDTGEWGGIFISGSILTSGIVNASGGQITGSNGILIGLNDQANPADQFSGGITNNGTITSPGGQSFDGITIANARFAGGITNNGTIFGGIGEKAAVFSGGDISNAGTIAGPTNGSGKPDILVGDFTFAGAVVNSGSLRNVSTTQATILIDDLQFGLNVAGGGIVNTGTGIIAGPVQVINTPTFFGGITNSGAISGNAGGGDISISSVSNFNGGVTNTGTLSTSTGAALFVQNVSQFNSNISNSGTITGAGRGIYIAGDVTFAGGAAIINSGNITESNITQNGNSGIGIDAGGASTAVTIDQTAGTITGAIKLSANADVLNITGGVVNGNIIGSGSSDTVNIALGTDSFTYSSTVSGVNAVDINSGTLSLAAGAAVITNINDIGALAFTGAGAINVTTISGSGLVEQLGIGATTLTGTDAVTGGTHVASGTLELAVGGSISGNATFDGTSATLQFDTAAGQLAGAIVGSVAGDVIDLRFQAFATGDQAVWHQSGATGTLSIETNSGSVLDTLALSGQYVSASFAVASDGHGGTAIELVTPSPPPPPTAPGTAADMIMRDGGNGDFEIYDLGGNSILAAASLGQVGLEWQVAGLGSFFGTDTLDMLLRNSNTGQFEVYDISNNAITNAAPMGQVGLEWSVAGFGDFSSHGGESDMLMRNSNTGVLEVYDISNNQITSAAPMGQVGLEWSVAGFGDFSTRSNETDMLMRNSNTGVFEVYDIGNNQITSAAPMGQVGLEWSVAGFGDFSGNANETDMLMRNSNTGAFEIYDISNNQITSAAPMGQVGLEWSVVGFGPINGAGTSDMLMRNNNTGTFEIYDITNNQITSAASAGQVGDEWQSVGLAADPPMSANAQFTQSMASYAASTGTPGASAPLDQTAVAPSIANTLLTLPNV